MPHLKSNLGDKSGLKPFSVEIFHWTLRVQSAQFPLLQIKHYKVRTQWYRLGSHAYCRSCIVLVSDLERCAIEYRAIASAFDVRKGKKILWFHTKGSPLLKIRDFILSCIVSFYPTHWMLSITIEMVYRHYSVPASGAHKRIDLNTMYMGTSPCVPRREKVGQSTKNSRDVSSKSQAGLQRLEVRLLPELRELLYIG